jgi:hypothetical protein
MDKKFERALRKACKEAGDWRAQARHAAKYLRQAVKAPTEEESGDYLEEASQCISQMFEVFWDRKEGSAENKYLDPNYTPDPLFGDIPSTSQVHLPERAWHLLYMQAKRDGVDIHTALARLILHEPYEPPEFPKLDFGGGPVQ